MKTTKDGREIATNTKADKAEYKRRTMVMAERQRFLCALCEMPLGDDITFDHEAGRGMGGSNRDDRIEINGKRKNAAVHSRCNVGKGSRRIPYLVQ